MSKLPRAVRLNAKDFQEDLGKLAVTMFNKVFREGRQHIQGPPYAPEDIGTLIRYGASIYNLLNYLNADERRIGDPFWHLRYGVTGMSLVRSLIDCLYNVTAILENPEERARNYRMSGLRKTLDDIDEDLKRYGADRKKKAFLKQRRKAVELLVRASGFTIDEVMQLRKPEMWPTFGMYVKAEHKGGTRTPNQEFLATFAHLHWRQYSALSHGAYEAFIGTLGLIPVGAYYVDDWLPQGVQNQLEPTYGYFLGTHIGRSATVFLCMLTEIQAYCRFDGANINDRLCKIWGVLLPLAETRELYVGRYAALMRDRGIIGADNEGFLTPRKASIATRHNAKKAELRKRAGAAGSRGRRRGAARKKQV